MCLLVLFFASLDAVHSHRSVNPLGTTPLHSGEHCVLCLAAHLPLAVSGGTAAIAPVFTAVSETPRFCAEPGLDRLSGFSLYIRPPPLV